MLKRTLVDEQRNFILGNRLSLICHQIVKQKKIRIFSIRVQTDTNLGNYFDTQLKFNYHIIKIKIKPLQN